MDRHNLRAGRSPRVSWALALVVLLAGGLALGVPGDVDESGRTDGYDLILFSRAFGSHPGEANWQAAGDLDHDGSVGAADLAILRKYFGWVGRPHVLWVGDAATQSVSKVSVASLAVLSATDGFTDLVALSVDLHTGDCWAADRQRREVWRMSGASGEVLVRVGGFSEPVDVSADSASGGCWVVDAGAGRVVRLEAGVPAGYRVDTGTGHHVTVRGFTEPVAASANPANGTCWVADASAARVVRLEAGIPDGYDVGVDTGQHTAVPGFGYPVDVAVNPVDGMCWVADRNAASVVKLSAGGARIATLAGQGAPSAVGVTPLDGACWVLDQTSDTANRISADGSTVLVRHGGLGDSVALATDAVDGRCWVASLAPAQVTALAAGGGGLASLTRFAGPVCLAVGTSEDVGVPPTARLAVTPPSPETGATVTLDASGSSDPDGTVRRYEWDVEGDGVFDVASAGSASMTHHYDLPGRYYPVLRVMDNDGLFGVDYSQVVRVGHLTATAAATPTAGTAPLTVQFSGSFIDPVDGRVSNYQWDFDGDGGFDYFSETTASTSHVYESAGTYEAAFKVTDTGGITAVDTVTITVAPSPPRVLAVTASPTTGVRPLAVKLEGSASDTDGRVVLYEWDFEGDGVYDAFSTASATVWHTYASGSEWRPVLTVVDNDGLEASATASVVLRSTGAAPVVTARATPSQGVAPLTVRLDATATDADGTIALYEWDFEGDGVFDWQSAASGEVSHTYPAAGSLRATVRVTDNQGDQTRSSVSVSVRPVGSPAVELTATPASGAAPLQVTLAATASDPGGAIVSYEWWFSEGWCYWVMDRASGEVLRLASDGTLLARVTGFGMWMLDAISASGPEGDCWVLWEDGWSGDPRITRLPAAVTGDLDVSARAGGQAAHSTLMLPAYADCSAVSVSPVDGRCWAAVLFWSADAGYQDALVLVEPGFPDGYAVTAAGGDFHGVVSLPSVSYGPVLGCDALAGGCWVSFSAPGDGNLLVHVAGDVPSGYDLQTGSGHHRRARQSLAPTALAVSEYDGSAICLRVAGGASECQALSPDFPDGYDLTAASVWHRTITIPKAIAEISVSPLDGRWWLREQNGNGLIRIGAGVPDGYDLSRDRGWHETRPVTDLDGEVTQINARAPSLGVAFATAASVGTTYFARSSTQHAVTRVDAFDIARGPMVPGGATVSHTYPQPGTELAMVRVTDNSGNASTATASVRVLSPPAAEALADGVGLCGLEVQFCSQAWDDDGRVVDYAWDFNGDGTYDASSASGGCARHAFGSPGTYTARLRVTDDDGLTATTSVTVRVLRAYPRVTVTATPASGNAPLAVQLDGSATDEDGTVVEYAWDFTGDGVYDWTSPTAAAVAHTYASAGEVTAILRAKDNDGQTTTAAVRIAVAAAGWPLIAAATATPSQGVAPLAVAFTASATDAARGITLYEWDFDGDGTYDGSSPTSGSASHTYLSAGHFLPVVRVTDGDGHQASQQLSVRVAGGHRWLGFSMGDHVVRVDAGGAPVASVSGFSQPSHVALDPRDGSCWVADYGKDRVVRLPADAPDGSAAKPQFPDDGPDGGFWATPLGSTALLADGQLGAAASVYHAADGLSLAGVALGADWTIEGWFTYPLVTSGNGNTLCAGIRDSHIAVTADGLLGTDDQTGWTGFHGSGYDLAALAATTVCFFADDMESGVGGWQAGAPWGLTETDANSPTTSWTDSPAGNYGSNIDTSLVSPPVDLRAASAPLWLVFSHRYGTESCCDPARVEVTTDNTHWVTLAEYRGYSGWATTMLDLSAYAGVPALRVRFRLTTDSSVVADGWYVDDVRICQPQWHHLAAVGSGGETAFYVDGEYVGTADSQSSEAVRVLGNGPDGNEPFGALDDVRVWGVARTEAEIRAGMDHELTGSEAGLVAYWRLDALEQNYTEVSGFVSPWAVAVDPNDGSCWVAEAGLDGDLVKLAPDGSERVRLANRSAPRAVAVDPRDGTCWLAEAGQVSRFTAAGAAAGSFPGILFAESLAVDPNDGSCWVAGPSRGRVVKLSRDGQELFAVGGLADPAWVSVEAESGSCWVAGRWGAQVVKLLADGSVAASSGGVGVPTGVSAVPVHGGAWVADNQNGALIRLAPNGGVEARRAGFVGLYSVSDAYGPGAASLPTAVGSVAPTQGEPPLSVGFSGTGSSPNGPIALYEWDFDGDGIYDWQSAAGGNTTYTYRVAGRYAPRLRVTDRLGAVATAARMIVHVGTDQVVATAEPASGTGPLLRTQLGCLALGVSSLVTAYAWDFDSDGVLDWSSAASAAVQHDFGLGTHYPMLRVTTADGGVRSDHVQITVVPAPPVPQGYAAPSEGTVPLEVWFYGSATDADGSVVRYEWDFNGDGTYDWESRTSAATRYTYTQVGTYEAVLRATDDAGVSATVTGVVRVMRLRPEVSALAVAGAGDLPLRVLFSGTATDGDGQVTSYAWDFQNDGTWDWTSTASPVCSHDYGQAGEYTAVLRVTDNDGLTATDSVRVVVTAPGMPRLVATAEPAAGGAPLPVTFRLTGSDPGGSIASFAVDFLGDGTYDWQSTDPAQWTVTTDSMDACTGRYPAGFTGDPALVPGGHFGSCLELDADGDGTSVEDHPELRLRPPFTMECWVLVQRSPGDWVRLVGKGSYWYRNYGLWLATNGTVLFQVGSAAGFEGTQTTVTVNDGAWHHLAGVYDGATMRVYVDGVEAGSAAVDAVPYTPAEPLTMGGAGYGGYLTGRLDDVQLWRTARTAAQIQADRVQELAGTEAGLVAYWPFNSAVRRVTAQTSFTFGAVGRFWPVARVVDDAGNTATQPLSVQVGGGHRWLGFSGGDHVVRVNAGGAPVATVYGFSTPHDVAVDPGDGSCWVADYGNGRVVRLPGDAADGSSALALVPDGSQSGTHPGSLVSGAVLAEGGRLGRALRLPANAAYMAVPDVALPESWTIEGWFQYPLPGGWDALCEGQGDVPIMVQGGAELGTYDGAQGSGFRGSGYDVSALAGSVQEVFTDDMESGGGGWQAQSPWARTTASAHSPTTSWTDSPGGNYANSANAALVSPGVNLVGLGEGVALSFWHRYNTESGYDRCRVEASTDGANWTELQSYTGASAWAKADLDLSGYVGAASFRVRFRLTSDGSVTDDGWYVDDVRITAPAWHHVAAVGSGGNTAFYVDGAYVGTASYQSRSPVRSIGNRPAGDQRFGAVDDVRVWSVARTPAQILAAMSQELVGTEPGLAAYWTFNEIAQDYQEVTGLGTPHALAVDPNDGSCWVMDNEYIGTVVRFSRDMDEIARIPDGGYYPRAGAVDPQDGSCWVVSAYDVRKYSAEGALLVTVDAPASPWAVAVDPADGSCWVADPGSHSVAKLDRNGTPLLSVAGLGDPSSVDVDPADGGCWVSDRTTGTVLKLSADGSRLSAAAGFGNAADVATATEGGGCWVADSGQNRLVRLSANGTVVGTVSGYAGIDAISGWFAEPGLALPSAAGSASPTVGEPPLDVAFSGTATLAGGAISLYEWDFEGDGEFDWSSPTSASTVHTYGRAGRYVPVLRATGSNGLTATDQHLSIGVGHLVATAAADPGSGAAPLAVQLSGGGFDPGSGIVLYEWDFNGDGIFDWSSPNGGSVSHSFGAGTHRAVLRVSTADGRTAAAVATVTVAPVLPVASANAQPGAGERPLAVTLVGSGSYVNDGAIQRYEWDYDGDGVFDWASATTANAYHTYRDVGTFNPVLRVTSSEGLTATAQTTVTVANAPPTVTASASPEAGYAPLAVAFSAAAADQDGQIVLCQWRFDVFRYLFSDTMENGVGDWQAGSPWARTAADSHSPGQCWTDSPAGNYGSSISVALVSPVIDLTAAAAPVTLRFWQRYATESGYDWCRVEASTNGSSWDGLALWSGTSSWRQDEVDLSAYAGAAALQVRFRLTSDGSVTGDGWYVDDVAVTATSATADLESDHLVDATHTYATAGAHSASLTVTDNDGATTAALVGITVLSNEQPTATATANPTAGDTPLTVQFTGTGVDPNGTIVTYEWDLDGNGSIDSQEQNPTHTYSTAGSYAARLQVTDNDGQTATDTVTLMAGVPPQALPRAYPTQGNAPLNVTFEAGGVDGDGTIEYYYWDFDGDGTADYTLRVSDATTHQFSTPGVYRASLRVVDNDGLTGDGWVTITVTTPGDFAVEADATPASGVAPLPVTLSSRVVSSLAPLTRFEWDFDGDGTWDWESGTTATTDHTYGADGLYLARLRVTDASGATATDEVVVQVRPADAPVVTATATPTAGEAAFNVQFNGTASDPDGSVVRYEWDFDGDGQYDWSSPTTAAAVYTYSAAGSFTAVLRATDSAGLRSTAAVGIQVSPGVTVEIDPIQFDPLLGQSAAVQTVVTAPTNMTVSIFDRGNTLMRSLVTDEWRTAGLYQDLWDGTGVDRGVAADGAYYVVVSCRNGTHVSTYDPRVGWTPGATTPPVSYPASFSPLDNRPLWAQYTLSSVSEVTCYISHWNYGGYWGAGERVKTLLSREPMPPGRYVTVWDGTDDQGASVVVGEYLIAVFAWALAPNAVIVRSKPLISDVAATPIFFRPAANPYASGETGLELSVRLSKPAAVSIAIHDATNRQVALLETAELPGGMQTVVWDGRDRDGVLVHEGDYRAVINARDSAGNQARPFAAQFRVYY